MCFSNFGDFGKCFHCCVLFSFSSQFFLHPCLCQDQSGPVASWVTGHWFLARWWMWDCSRHCQEAINSGPHYCLLLLVTINYELAFYCWMNTTTYQSIKSPFCWSSANSVGRGLLVFFIMITVAGILSKSAKYQHSTDKWMQWPTNSWYGFLSMRLSSFIISSSAHCLLWQACQHLVHCHHLCQFDHSHSQTQHFWTTLHWISPL